MSAGKPDTRPGLHSVVQGGESSSSAFNSTMVLVRGAEKAVQVVRTVKTKIEAITSRPKPTK